MTQTSSLTATILPGRAVLTLTGTDVAVFLQGLVSNDTALLSPTQALFAALLTPQGKFLHELILAQTGEAVLIDTEATRRADLARRLAMYRLRAKIVIAPADDLAVAVVFGEGAAAALGLDGLAGTARPLDGGVAFVDPRLDALGVRLIAARTTIESVLAAAGIVLREGEAEFDRHRLLLGVPDGSRDIPVDKGFLLEANFEELNGVSFTKGCYVGQELTARTKHRGTIRKRLFRVDFDPGVAPPLPDSPVLLGDRDAGTMRSAVAGTGIALLRLEEIEKAAGEGRPLTVGDVAVTPVKPAFLVL